MSRLWNTPRQPELVRPLETDDLDYLRKLDEEWCGSLDDALRPCLKALREGLVKSAQSHTSFSRYVASGTTGHISAHLAEPGSARAIFESGDIVDLFAMANSELDVETLRAANRSAVGTSLVISSLRWAKADDDSASIFVLNALAHLTRWFVGNCIESILIYYPWDADRILAPLCDGLEANIVSTRSCSAHLWMKLIERNGHYVTRDWRNHGGSWLGAWSGQLLAYPQYALTGYKGHWRHLMSDSRKLQGRILYEYDFDSTQAVRACIPTWSINEHNGKLHIPSLDEWRKEVSLDLNINPDRSHGFPTLAEIFDRIKSDPSVLAVL